ncbi:PIN domain-containing protein [Lichenibacterium dinghuense]|uniref:PIN domain-containing protein n=1 Tax=Lichenibacterium dinghuense TaxID=2895977 RepID=UPI001F1C9717|nr:PIN domain-containing protein [Lichenibacterium sp. 6Y81]
MLRLLADSCIWLDIVKDYRHEPVLSAVEHLVEARTVSLVVPRLVVEEFARRKDEVVRGSVQGIATTLKRAREVVAQFGTDGGRPAAMAELHDVDLRLSRNGEELLGAVARVERLFAGAGIVDTTASVKLRAADRGLEGRAPFQHKNKNGMADAVLIEMYADVVAAERGEGRTFAFVTVNHTDFSLPGGDRRTPHPDIADLFGADGSTFSNDLVAVLKAHDPDYFDEREAFEEFAPDEPRLVSEIVEATGKLCDQVWYNRHWNLRHEVETGKVRVVDGYKHRRGEMYPRDIIERSIWEGALASAARMEEKHPDDLGPWDDFEWGMLNGKLSALRWVLGDEWDMLDT